MTGRNDEQVPQLLPSIRNPKINAALMDSLRVLSEHTGQPEVRERIDEVLAGRASLRELARDESFAAVVGPAAERGWQQRETMSEKDREALAAEARQRFDQDG